MPPTLPEVPPSAATPATTAPIGAAPALLSIGPRLTPRQRDFLLLNIFVLTQHGYVDRAGVLAEALFVMGDTAANVQLARAVLRFLAGEWAATLTCLEELDRIDPVERFGQYRLSHAQRMRRYLQARCLFELGDTARAKEALEVYMRHGEDGSGAR